MSFSTRKPSGVHFPSQTTLRFFRQRQLPVWVLACLCLLLAGGFGRAAASSPAQVFAAGCSELLVNGGFEVKDYAWQTFGAESPPAYTTSPVFSGEQAMRLGIVEGPNLAIINGVRQSVFLPNSASSLVLGFHYRPIHESLPGDDLQYLELYDATSGVQLVQLHAALNNSVNWIFLQYDLTALKGKTIRIDVGVRNNGGGGRTALIIDDLSLLSCDAGAVTPVTPTATPTGLSMLATPTPTATNPLQTRTPTISPTVTPTPSVSATASATASATPTPTVVLPPTATPIPTAIPTGCANILENGSFEQPLGSSTGWLPGDGDPVAPVLSSEHADGLRSMQLGNPPGTSTRDTVSYSSVRQLVTIPATASTAELLWRHQSRSQEVPSNVPTPPQDRQELILLHPNLDTKEVRKRWREEVPSWQEWKEPMTMYIGHSFYIYFNVFNDVNSTRTWMFLDDVRLIVCYATAAVTATATPTAMPVLGATVTPTPPALGSTATLTTTGDVAIAAQAMSTPGNGELSSGFSSPLASDMLGEARTSDPVAPASTSPLWTAFLVWVSGNRIPIFVTLLVFVLVAIFALRR